MKVYLSFTLIFSLLISSNCLADWPSLPFPEGSKTEIISEQMRLNGVPMRMYRVVNQQSLEKTRAYYHRELGRSKYQTPFGLGYVLTENRDDYLITARLTPMSEGVTEVLLSTSDAREAQRVKSAPVGFSLPASSQILSDMESVDAGKFSRQLVVMNGNSSDVNAVFITNTLSARGYQFQPNLSVNNKHKKSLMFTGEKREANVVIVNQDGTSKIVITTILTP